MSVPPDVNSRAVTSLQRRQAGLTPEKLPQLALEQVGLGTILFDPRGELLSYNSTARSWLGEYSDDPQAAAWPFASTAMQADGSTPLPAGETPLARARRGEPVVNAEIVIAASLDRPLRHLSVQATPLVFEGEPAGLVLILHDITARIHAETTLQLAKQQAARASDAKGNFLSAMSHELRTPLNAILGFAQILKREAALSPEHASHLDLINRSGEHILSVINEALDISRVEAGELALDLTSVAVDAQVQDVAAILRPRAEEKRLGLEASCAWPGSVRTDAGKLRQILFNLLGNAIKFTSQGKVSIRVNLQETGQGSRLIFEVEDTGPGIAPADLARIFEPFYRADANAAQQGTGLGLTITRQYVELLEGVITVTSTPGVGTCFRVELPVEVIPPADLAGQAMASPSDGDLLAEGQSPCRILIVEDHRTNANLLRRIMENAGFLVRVAENGALAIEVFSTWQPHFIWMDVMMPGMDGPETTRAIRALPGGSEVKIVALSACSLQAQGATMLAAGCDDFLTKPSPAKTLVACVARHLGRVLIPEGPRPQPTPAAPANAPLAHLPRNLHLELRAAVLSLDAKEIAVTIDRIRSLAPETAQQLSLQAQQLNYTALLQASAALPA